MTRQADGNLLLFETAHVERLLPVLESGSHIGFTLASQRPLARRVPLLVHRGVASYVFGRATTNLPC